MWCLCLRWTRILVQIARSAARKLKRVFQIAWLRRRQVSSRKHQSRSRNGRWFQGHGRIYQNSDGGVQSDQIQKKTVGFAGVRTWVSSENFRWIAGIFWIREIALNLWAMIFFETALQTKVYVMVNGLVLMHDIFLKGLTFNNRSKVFLVTLNRKS